MSAEQKLNFPVLSGEETRPYRPKLTMDQFVEFVDTMLRATTPEKIARQHRRRDTPVARFSLR
jgi:hypothetical protein